MRHFLKAAALAGLLAATGAQAADLSGPAAAGGYKDGYAAEWWGAGDIFIRLRGEAVLPQVSTSSWKLNGAPNAALDGANASITNSGIPELDISYFLTKNIAVEAICCVSPHTVNASGTIAADGKIADTWLFPPTVLLQYHFDGAAVGLPQFKPYVGAGVNYTVFFDNNAGTNFSDVKIGDRWGAAVQAGFDYHLQGNWFLNVDFKKLWLNTDASATIAAGAAAGDRVSFHVNIDPIIVGAGIGYRFGGGYIPLK
jgi:outer membrane protein